MAVVFGIAMIGALGIAVIPRHWPLLYPAAADPAEAAVKS
jgi:hypothetical protein